MILRGQVERVHTNKLCPSWYMGIPSSALAPAGHFLHVWILAFSSVSSTSTPSIKTAVIIPLPSTSGISKSQGELVTPTTTHSPSWHTAWQGLNWRTPSSGTTRMLTSSLFTSKSRISSAFKSKCLCFRAHVVPLLNFGKVLLMVLSLGSTTFVMWGDLLNTVARSIAVCKPETGEWVANCGREW